MKATDACVDAPLAPNTTVTVTFYVAGRYQIMCKPHAPYMQTAVLLK